VNNSILQQNNHIFTMSAIRLASPIPVSFPAAHRRRLNALARRHGVSAAAIVRAGVDLALPELERSRQPASAIQPAGAGIPSAITPSAGIPQSIPSANPVGDQLIYA
jgi:hypothetical protein